MPGTSVGPRRSEAGFGSRPARLAVEIGAGVLLLSAAWAIRSSDLLHEYVVRSKSLPELEAAVRVAPGDGISQFYLARSYLHARRFSDAIAAYRVAIRLDPDSARAHLELGVALYNMLDLASAQAEFVQTLRLDPRSATAEYFLGKLAWVTGDTSEALRRASRAVTLDPANDQAWYARGICHMQRREWDAAEESLRRAIQLRPSSAPFHTALGEVLLHHASPRNGLSELQRALQLDPDNGPALALVGSALLHRPRDPDLRAAETALSRAVRVRTYHPGQAWNALGEVYEREGRYHDAAAAFERAMRSDPRDEAAYYALARIYHKVGDAADAAIALQRFRHVSDLQVQKQSLEDRLRYAPLATNLHLALARVYTQLGMLAQAHLQYTVCLRLRPNSAVAAEDQPVLAALATEREEGFAPAVPNTTR